MDYVMIVAAILCAWAVLRVLGGERERRVRDLVHTIAAGGGASATAPPALPPGAQPPVRSKPGR